MNVNTVDNTVSKISMVALAALAAGEIGVISADVKVGENPMIDVDRRYERKYDIAAFPQNGFSLYERKMVESNVDLKDKVFTVKGKTDESGGMTFNGGDTGNEMCKQLNFEVKAEVKTVGDKVTVEVKFNKVGDRQGGAIVLNLPEQVKVGLGLFADGSSEAKVGCDVLFNDGKTDKVAVMRYSFKEKMTIDMGKYLTDVANK